MKKFLDRQNCTKEENRKEARNIINEADAYVVMSLQGDFMAGAVMGSEPQIGMMFVSFLDERPDIAEMFHKGMEIGNILKNIHSAIESQTDG